MAKILIVDDDQYLRELYQEIIQDIGYEVDSAVDGEEGFKKITENKYDLVLLDVMMPKLDGLGVLKKLKEINKTDTKIIVLTNLAHDPIIEESLKNGALNYLIKADITPDQLIEAIKKEIE